MTAEPSLVPPVRLGALLTERRTQRGLTIEELRVQAELPFSAAELRAIEQGSLALSDDQVNRLMVAYGAGCGLVVPERSELVVDLHRGAMFVASNTKVLPAGASVDDILGRYLSLLYLMRGLEPGRELSLRTHDLEVLASALERTIVDVERRLVELMLPGQVMPWFSRVRHRLAVPAAGIFVGLTTVGSLVLVQFPAGERAQLEPAVGGPAELGSAVAVVRSAPGAAGVAYQLGDPTSVGAAALSLIPTEVTGLLEDWRIEYEGERDGYRGHTNTVTRTISLYVSAADSPEAVAEVLAHEIGHALDVMYLDDDARQRWLDARGIDAAWWPTSGSSDFAAGAGDFAEAVAAVLLGSPSDSEHGRFDAADLALVAELLPIELG